MTTPPRFIAGLDVGKHHDYSALAIVERHRFSRGFDHVYWRELFDWELHVRRLVRFPLGVSYRELVNLIEYELRTPALGIDTPLVIDATGVGDVLADLLRGSVQHLVAVTITAGDRSTVTGGRWHVPKEHLVKTLALLLEQDKLAVSARLPLAPVLQKELSCFEARIRPSGRTTFGSFQSGVHDDLAMAVALACWFARHHYPEPGPEPHGGWW